MQIVLANLFLRFHILASWYFVFLNGITASYRTHYKIRHLRLRTIFLTNWFAHSCFATSIVSYTHWEPLFLKTWVLKLTKNETISWPVMLSTEWSGSGRTGRKPEGAFSLVEEVSALYSYRLSETSGTAADLGKCCTDNAKYLWHYKSRVVQCSLGCTMQILNVHFTFTD